FHRWGLKSYQTLVSNLVLYGGIPIQDAERLTDSYAFFLLETLEKNLNPTRQAIPSWQEKTPILTML
ncbi:hypothetical protein J4Y29_26345, partial [Escherichia coli]